MKRIVLLPLALVAALCVATAAGADNTAVTLTANKTTVVFGKTGIATLTATVSPAAAGQKVVLTTTSFGKSAETPATVTKETAADGTVTFTVEPSIQTTYHVTYGTVTSAPVTVNVRPLVGFGLHHGLYLTRVTAAGKYWHHTVVVQRRGSAGWVNIRRVLLASTSKPTTFHLSLPHGRSLLRVFLPAGQAGRGYVASWSRGLAVTR